MPLNPPTTETTSTFDADLANRHIIYDYEAHDHDGNPDKWRYEIWFYNADRVIYSIHGGPMAGRRNYQEATYQCIRPGELWQCNWLEETGSICSLVFDIPQGTVTTLLGLSRGHWERNGAAKGNKKVKEDLERWRGLAEVGRQSERMMLSKQASIVEDFRGAGELEGIEMDWPTI
ncbi:uncharacterized protein EURHEDRAFT_295601 [Aspergillus ruber CBS 135680]|uniref:Calycin-like protein n=1 Tax=Aspergillus ruber (strain CBS 135680) TaxID=1388766 RepID=A0A017SKK0_ASPRC|nr:uncharacterized protein EURHEDRAFT_295601 [Aspergillus ruber CBS 135680]EYE97478.1 hypothetical protein EURHEDRAFT_295601 [Aspergillus ruber CBS 135680]